MRGRFIENHKVPRLAWDIINDFRVRLPQRNLSGAWKVCLMAPRNHTEPTVSGIHVCELILKNDHAATHLPVRVDIILRPIEMVVAGSVYSQSLRPGSGSENERGAIHPPPAPMNRIELVEIFQ